MDNSSYGAPWLPTPFPSLERIVMPTISRPGAGKALSLLLSAVFTPFGLLMALTVVLQLLSSH